MSYKLHLPEAAYERLERARATDDGMPEAPEHARAVHAPVSVQSAYERGRKAEYRDVDNGHIRNPYASPRLREAFSNGVADELESFA